MLTACSPADPFAETSKALTEQVLLPAYVDWAETDRRLAASAIAFCADNEPLDQARQPSSRHRPPGPGCNLC